MEDFKTELILVYNADSGFFNIVKDALHKTVSPNTYQCNLCALTFGTISMKSKWKRFIDKLRIHSKFLHRDEFFRMLKTHPHTIENVAFPAIFLHQERTISILVTSAELNQCETLEALMGLVDDKIVSLK